MKISPAVVVLICFLALPTVAASFAAEETVLFKRRESGGTDRVVVRLEVGGDTKYTEEGKPQHEKMGVLCNLDYFEKILKLPIGDDDIRRSVRDYTKVSVAVTVGDGEFKPTLAPEHRLIAVEAAKQSALIFSPAGNLTRDELDAIDIPANSLLVDRLLPETAVAVGDRWPHSQELLAAMLGLDEVAKCTVQSTLKEVTSDVARFEITGRVEGAVYGVSTTIEIKGKYRFDRRAGQIDWLGMLIKENRAASFVADGLDVVSRLQMVVAPAAEPASLTDAALDKLVLKPTPAATRLSYESPSGDWRCLHDRRWYIHHQRPQSTVAILRMLDRGELSAQCNVSSLPQRQPDQLVSLEEFQEDVRRALGKSFGEFVEASSSSSDAKYRIYRVAAEGVSSEIPMRWIYYLVADPQGRQAALTFAVEQKLVERFAEADKPLVQSLRFEPKQDEKDGRAVAEKTEKQE